MRGYPFVTGCPRRTYTRWTIPLSTPNANIFELFWHANRATEHTQDRVLGLLDKHLLGTPDDALARVCKACLIIQMSHEWDSAETRKSAITVALEMIRDTNLELPDKMRCHLALAVGISLAQLPSSVGMDSASAGILRQFTQGTRFARDLTDDQRQEAYVALGAVAQALGRSDDARATFIAARAFGLDQGADSFGDYQDLKSLRHS